MQRQSLGAHFLLRNHAPVFKFGCMCSGTSFQGNQRLHEHCEMQVLCSLFHKYAVDISVTQTLPGRCSTSVSKRPSYNFRLSDVSVHRTYRSNANTCNQATFYRHTEKEKGVILGSSVANTSVLFFFPALLDLQNKNKLHKM